MEDYLGRAASPFSEEFWKRLDEAVVLTDILLSNFLITSSIFSFEDTKSSL